MANKYWMLLMGSVLALSLAVTGCRTGNDDDDDDSTTTADYTLQLIHAADMEAGVEAVDDAPRFSSIINAFKDAYPNTLILSSGDNYIPSPFYVASSDPSMSTLLGQTGNGRADILILNAMGFQASALGNHEFDEGTGLVEDIIAVDEDDDGTYAGAAFPYLSSNLDFTGTGLESLVTTDGQEASLIPNKIAKSTVITVNGERIGIVGATTPILDQISSTDDVVVLPTDEDDLDALAAIIQTEVDALTGTGINKVITLMHMQQIAIETELAGKLKDVDIIVAGGSDTILTDSNDRLRDGHESSGDYPRWLTSSTGETVALVNTDGQYQYVGRLVIGFDSNGILIPSTYDANVSGAYAADDQGVTDTGSIDADSTVVSIIDGIRSVITEKDGNTFGSTSVYLNGERASVRTEETNLGNLTADANLWYAQQQDSTVQVSLKNGGGIRAAIGTIEVPPGGTGEGVPLPPQASSVSGKAEGEVSQLDIENTLRFNNSLDLVTLTAQQLVEVLEHGVAATEDGATPGQFPQVAGVNFSFDPSLTANSRIRNAVIVDSNGTTTDTLVTNGAIIGDTSRTIRIVSLGFLIGGGDSYPYPSFQTANTSLFNQVELDKTLIATTGTLGEAGNEQDALAAYLKQFYSSTAFSIADTSSVYDTRIQNISVRSDTVGQ